MPCVLAVFQKRMFLWTMLLLPILFPSSSTTSSSFSRPVRKYLNFEARATSSSTNYSSPLERYLKDAEIQVSVQTDLVKKAQNAIDEFNSSIPNIDKRSPSCSLCHRRENHNRVNCPYKPYKCESAFTCGDLEKHKDEKDQLIRLQQGLNTEKQKLKKLELQLKSKKESRTKTVISFNSRMRNRLVESNHAKYLSKDGKEKWRVINMDLSLLDQHFKGKVPDDDIDLQEALEYISMHRLMHKYVTLQANQTQTTNLTVFLVLTTPKLPSFLWT